MNVLIVFVVSDWVYICALICHAKIDIYYNNFMEFRLQYSLAASVRQKCRGRLEKEQYLHGTVVQSMD